MKMVIGLDVHSKITHYFSQNLDGQTIREGAVATSVEGLSEMLGQLNAPLETRIGLETGTQATLVARILPSERAHNQGWGAGVPSHALRGGTSGGKADSSA